MYCTLFLDENDGLIVQPRYPVLIAQPAQGRCFKKVEFWVIGSIKKISKAHKIGYLCVQMHLMWF